MVNRITTIFVLVVFCVQLNAQEVWGLQKCIETTLANNLGVENANLGIKDAEISKKQSIYARYPNLSAGSGVFWNFGRTIDPTSNQFITETFFSNNYSLNTGLVLYDGGRIRNGIKQSELDLKIANLDKEQIERNLALDVASAYLNALFRKENLTIAANNISATQQQIDQLTKFIESGARAQNEILDLESQLAQNEQAQVEAINNYDLSLLNLKILMQVDFDQNFDVVAPGGVGELLDPDFVDVNDLFSRARTNERSIESREMQILSSEIAEKIAASQGMPRLSFGGNVGTNYSNKGVEVIGVNSEVVDQTVFIDNNPVNVGFSQFSPILANKNYFNQITDNLSYGVGFNLNVPIFNNYSTKGNVKRAEINTTRSKLSLKQEELNLRSSVQQALADAKAAKRAFEAAEKSRNAQQNAYDNAEIRFNLGNVTSFELSNQKANLDNAELNVLVSKYDYIFRTKIIDYYLGNPLKFN